MSGITTSQIDEAFLKVGCNKTEIAKFLGVSRGAVYRWFKKNNPSSMTKDAFGEVRAWESRIRKAEDQLEREKARRTDAERELEKAIEREASFSVVKDFVPTKIPKGNIASGKGTAEAVVLISDWHAGENITRESVNDLNEFSPKICEARAIRLFQKVCYLLDFSRHLCKLDNITLFLGGDFINNYIHDELEESNLLGPAEEVIFVSELLAGGIEHLLKNAGIKNITAVCTRGNHGRTTHRMRHSTDYRSSWESVLYKNLAVRFKKESRVRWVIPEGYMAYTEVAGHTCRFHHGENTKYMGGVGGITIPLNKSMAQWQKAKHADFTFQGHYHTWLDTPQWTVNGSLVGYGPFSLAIKADYEPPRQGFVVIDKTYGKTLAIPVFLEKVVK